MEFQAVQRAFLKLSAIMSSQSCQPGGYLSISWGLFAQTFIRLLPLLIAHNCCPSLDTSQSRYVPTSGRHKDNCPSTSNMSLPFASAGYNSRDSLHRASIRGSQRVVSKRLFWYRCQQISIERAPQNLSALSNTLKTKTLGVLSQHPKCEMKSPHFVDLSWDLVECVSNFGRVLADFSRDYRF